jgi:Flp pilus assembly protein TadD
MCRDYILYMHRWISSRLVLALAATVIVAAAPASAQDKPPTEAETQSRLDRLLDSLSGSESAEEAKRIEASIEAIWLHSGSATSDLLIRRALDAFQRDDHAAALTLLTASIDAAPDYAEAYNKRATIHFVDGNYQRALWDIRQTLRLEPRHYGAWAGLGRLFEQAGDDVGALEAYRRALALNPYLDDLPESVERLELIVRGREI